MLLSNISIKSRLLILCLIPTLVIVALSVHLVRQVQVKLHSNLVVSEKFESLKYLTQLTSHLHQALDPSNDMHTRANGELSKTPLTLSIRSPILSAYTPWRFLIPITHFPIFSILMNLYQNRS